MVGMEAPEKDGEGDWGGEDAEDEDGPAGAGEAGEDAAHADDGADDQPAAGGEPDDGAVELVADAEPLDSGTEAVQSHVGVVMLFVYTVVVSVTVPMIMLVKHVAFMYGIVDDVFQLSTDDEL
jgi:hypothetical protein